MNATVLMGTATLVSLGLALGFMVAWAFAISTHPSNPNRCLVRAGISLAVAFMITSLSEILPFVR